VSRALGLQLSRDKKESAKSDLRHVNDVPLSQHSNCHKGIEILLARAAK
jgi:hypothetical protein